MIQQPPEVFLASAVKGWQNSVNVAGTNYWVPARPKHFYYFWLNPEGVWERLKIAFKVFIGQYDALDWAEQANLDHVKSRRSDAIDFHQEEKPTFDGGFECRSYWEERDAETKS